ncbi:gonadotropin-releasing hormone receptor-like [Schistocerca serialis cubense]|uniref:gonadotropin-releasing hormone receptor-like n=1 Tax=Schistocerca serialis cubense TaxID=2023355 RepID=UPI00214DF484|nr:gonadotropin-releasing hormone receptor-like [Schistocerca serialis cubense]
MALCDGNAATIASIRRRPARQPSAVYALILHLSAADLLVTVFCIAGEAAWSYAVQWLAGNAACKLFKFAQVFSLYLSTFILVLIGIDRFVAVRYPMRALGTAKRLSRLIAFVWVLSMLLSIPQMVIFHVERGPFCELFLQCVTYGFYTEPWQEQLYAAFSLMCMFVLPLAILIGTYVSTVITIARSERAFRAEVAVGLKSEVLDANRRRLIHRAKTKSMRISVVIVVAFIVWWTPYYCMMIIFLFLNPDKHLSEDLQSAIFFFGMSNSLVNPIIYGAFHLWRPKRRGRLSDRGRDGSTFTQRSLMGSMRRVRPPTAEETTLVALEEGPAAAAAAPAVSAMQTTAAGGGGGGCVYDSNGGGSIGGSGGRHYEKGKSTGQDKEGDEKHRVEGTEKLCRRLGTKPHSAAAGGGGDLAGQPVGTLLLLLPLPLLLLLEAGWDCSWTLDAGCWEEPLLASGWDRCWTLAAGRNRCWTLVAGRNRGWPPDAGCRLLAGTVAGCWTLAAGCWQKPLLAADRNRCWLLAGTAR